MASQSETKDKLLEAIDGALAEAEKYEGMRRAVIVRELSLAYRYLAGGPQPGSAVIDAK